MKLTHWLSLASVAVSLPLFFAGQEAAGAFFFFGLPFVIELTAAILTGKRGNDTER